MTMIVFNAPNTDVAFAEETTAAAETPVVETPSAEEAIIYVHEGWTHLLQPVVVETPSAEEAIVSVHESLTHNFQPVAAETAFAETPSAEEATVIVHEGWTHNLQLVVAETPVAETPVAEIPAPESPFLPQKGAVATWTVQRVLKDSAARAPYAYICRRENWTTRLSAKQVLPGVILQVGDQVQLECIKIDNFDPQKPFFFFSQKTPAARAFLQEHQGKVVEGTVATIADIGAFVDIGTGIVGLVHKLAMAPQPSKGNTWKGALQAKESAHSQLQVGGKIRVVVVSFELNTDPKRLGQLKVDLSQEQVGFSRLRALFEKNKATADTPFDIQTKVLGQDPDGNYELALFEGDESLVVTLPADQLSCAVERGGALRVIVDKLETNKRGRPFVKVHQQDGAKARAAAEVRRQENRDRRISKQPSKGKGDQKSGKKK
jgi:hypothetical protein